MKFHPLAGLFPLMEGEEFESLKKDIKLHGLMHPIVVFPDKQTILDGRNRYRACVETSTALSTIVYDGDDPAGFVISSNLCRRHLNESQRAMVAAKLATMRHGGDRSKGSIDLLTQNDTASLLNVSVPSVKRATAVQRYGEPELAQAVERGEFSVTAAAKVAREPPDAQREAIADRATSKTSPNNPTKTTPKPKGDAEILIPITKDEIRDLYKGTDDDIRDWLTAYAAWPPKKKKAAWKLFINLTAIGDI